MEPQRAGFSVDKLTRPLVASVIQPLNVALDAITAEIRRGWNPLELGASLVEWMDSADGIALSGSQITGWSGRKFGYTFTQSSGVLRPTFQATGFNGAPAVAFDGATYLECTDAAFLAALPAGAAAGEIWVVSQQDDVATDTTVRAAVSYGGAASTSRRAVERTVNAGVNRPRIAAGDGVGIPTVSNSAVAMNGRHLVRGLFTPTSIRADIDGIAGTPTAVVPATVNTRARIGAVSNTTASNLYKGKHRHVIFIVGNLSTLNAARLTQWGLAQRML